jgi:hypothetical protein
MDYEAFHPARNLNVLQAISLEDLLPNIAVERSDVPAYRSGRWFLKLRPPDTCTQEVLVE